MVLLTDADLPDGISQGLYLSGIIFEFIMFSLVLVIVVLSILKLRERGTRLNRYMVFICIAMDIALFSTALGKSGVLLLGWSFEIGTVFDNIALLFIFFINCIFLAFNLEMFTQLPQKKRNLFFGIYILCYIPAILETILNIFQIGILSNIIHLLLSLILYSMMMNLVHKNIKSTEKKEHRIGIQLIFSTGLFMLLFFVFTGISILLITFGILYPFNFLYFVSWVCMILALFLFYTGFFLPIWLKNFLKE